MRPAASNPSTKLTCRDGSFQQSYNILRAEIALCLNLLATGEARDTGILRRCRKSQTYIHTSPNGVDLPASSFNNAACRI